jgi:hypothetical protein
VHEISSPYLPHGASAAIVALASLALLGVAVAAFVRMSLHRKAAQLARAATEHGTLTPGLSVLRGVVATAHGQPAVTVSITQHGTERTDRRRTFHTWKETAREHTSEPFTLVLDDGTQVDVEPGPGVFLVDQLTQASQPGTTTRVMRASLDHGERVFVEGTLKKALGASRGDEGYRGSSTRWTLTPPPTGPMLLCTESLEARHERRERFWRYVVISLLGVLTATQLLAFDSFWPLMRHGVRCDVEITSITEHVTSGRHTVHHHYAAGTTRVCAGHPDLEGLPVMDEVGRNASRALREGDHVPFVVLATDPRVHAIGAHAGLRPRCSGCSGAPSSRGCSAGRSGDAGCPGTSRSAWCTRAMGRSRASTADHKFDPGYTRGVSAQGKSRWSTSSVWRSVLRSNDASPQRPR